MLPASLREEAELGEHCANTEGQITVTLGLDIEVG